MYVEDTAILSKNDENNFTVSRNLTNKALTFQAICGILQ